MNSGPPMFLNSTNVLRGKTVSAIQLPVKAHTALINECLLKSASTHSITRKVDCILTGHLPDLVLHVILGEDHIAQGDWILTIYNEGGFANTTLTVTKGSVRY